MRLTRRLLAATSLFALTAGTAASQPAVVADIAPVHSIVARVMDGVGAPDLLLPPGASPHGYALRPSEAALLEEADIVFWVGEALTPWLAAPLANIAGDARLVALMDADGVTVLPVREGGPFEAHTHDHDHVHDREEADEAALAHEGVGDDHDHDHGHDHEHEHEHEHGHDHEHDHAADQDHDHAHDHAEDQDHDHSHDHDHDHGHDHGHDHEHDHAEDEDQAHDQAHDHDHDHDDGHPHDDDHDHAHEHDHDHGHAHGHADGHIWLDPTNAAAMAAAIAEALAEIDTDNAEAYRANAAAFDDEMSALVTEIAADLAALERRGFIVFHDAYQYFEARFGMPASGSISLHDADTPSPARMSEIQTRVREADITCVFAEPQFEPRLIETAIEGSEASPGVLDPLGAELEPGPDLYPTLIRTLADDLISCLDEG